ncbi:MAG: CDP-alcohol phosphatidyltransferase family protein [Deltaproteobacteria bacterium]
MRWTAHIPNALTASRFVIAAWLILDALDGAASVVFVPLFLAAGVTDALDGMLARLLRATSLRGTLLDSYADIVLYGSAFVCAVLLYPDVIRSFAGWIVALFAFQFFSWGFSLVKFRRMTSYHTYSAKAWAALLFVSLAFLFALKSTAFLIPMFVIGILANTEESFITAVMPYWKAGITGLREARRLRDAYKNPPLY